MPGIYVGASEVKSIYVGTTPVKSVYVGTTKVRPTELKTVTITWTEQSNIASSVVYSDDAAGLTAGDTAFDEFFGYSAVRLNGSGVETASITQAQSGGPGKLDITQLGTLTSGDNVMIKFPVRGIKMTKSGSTVTLSITKELNKSGYQYYAHSTGTLSNPGTPKDAFYLGAYKGYTSTYLKSWSGQTPTVSKRQSVFCSNAKGGGSGYNIIGFYQRMYVNALYMMKYGNPNGKVVVGQGRSQGGSSLPTGGTNSQINATYGTSNREEQMKLFGLEDRWGNVWENVGGCYTDSNNQIYAMLTGWSGQISGGEATGATFNNSNQTISSIFGDNKTMFSKADGVRDTTCSTYYSGWSYGSPSYLAAAGDYYDDYYSAGPLTLVFNVGTTKVATHRGSRLMYMSGLT